MVIGSGEKAWNILLCLIWIVELINYVSNTMDAVYAMKKEGEMN